jgi:hypothetical protein
MMALWKVPWSVISNHDDSQGTAMIMEMWRLE